MPGNSASTEDRQWYIVGRWQDYEGEARANLVRIGAIGGFYIVQLLHFYVFTAAEHRDDSFQRSVTWLAVAWALLALAIYMCIRRRILPAALKYVSTGCDIVMLTSLAAIGPKAESPLVLVFFLIIALSALRFRLRLIWCATLGSMLAYEALVGLSDERWFDAEHAVPPVNQLVMLLSLGLTGIIVGQVVRRVRGIAEDYAQRLSQAEQKP